MKNIIPVFYSEYGRYINRFRAIPSFIDGLKPVERRILLSLYKEARKKIVKSATIVGYALGHLHPHGDQSLYKTLVNMVHQGYAKGEGNWGSPGLEDAAAAAYRYCVTGDTKIPTTKGYISIEELSKYASEDIDEEVFDYAGNKVHASKFFNSGKHPIIKIQTSYGYSLKGSYNHPILILTKDLELKWKILSELEIGDCIVLRGNIDYNRSQDTLNENYSKILGCYISEGWCTTQRNFIKIGFSSTDKEYFNSYCDSLKNLYPDIPITIQQQIVSNNKILYTIEVYDIDLFDHGIENLENDHKKIPDVIWKSNKTNQKIFLQYLFTGGGDISFDQKSSTIMIIYTSNSQQLLQELQQLLLMSFDIITLIREKSLVICGARNCTEFSKIGFFGQKQKRLLEFLRLLKIGNTSKKTDCIPEIRQYLLDRYDLSKFKADFYDIQEAWNTYKSQIASKDDLEKIDNLLNANYRFDRISNIEKLEAEEVYSIRVDSDNHSFIGNGFINHNTEVSLQKWVDELAFTYLDEKFVPYQEFELEPEPLYLPSPVPIGLIGNGVITGISFYTTLIPRYKLSDLAKRLAWILNGKKEDEEIIIQPNSLDCTVQEANAGDFKNILTTGKGSVYYIPNGRIDRNNKVIHIQGRAPNAKFDLLKRDQEKLDIYLIDNSGSEIDIVVEPCKKSTDLNALAAKIWQDYLIHKINFNGLFCDNEGKVKSYGIDDILINNFNLWKYSVQLKNIDEFNKLSNKKIELMAVQIIRYIFEQFNKSSTVEEIIKHFKELKKDTDINIEIDVFDIDNDEWKKEIKQIEEQDIIEVCNKRSIRNLIETVVDIQKVDKELLSARSLIDNNERNCINHVVKLAKD